MLQETEKVYKLGLIERKDGAPEYYIDAAAYEVRLAQGRIQRFSNHPE